MSAESTVRGRGRPPWHSDAVFGEPPATPFAAYDGQTWVPAGSAAEFEQVLRTKPEVAMGPFKLPSSSRLLSRYDLPGVGEQAIQQLRIDNHHRMVDALRTLGVIALIVYLLGASDVLVHSAMLLGVLFGLIPLAQALQERWQMSRPDFEPPGVLEDLRFDAWQEGRASQATNILLALLIAVYVWTWWASGATLNLAPSSEVLEAFGQKDTHRILDGEYWRLFTCVFLHGNLVHLLFNAFALHQLGRIAERVIGSGRFVLWFVATGLAGSLASMWMSPNVPSVGASGAICGLLGALVAFTWTPYAPSYLDRHARSMVLGLVLLGFFVPRIDNAAHAGGLAAGMLIGWWYFNARWSARQPLPQSE